MVLFFEKKLPQRRFPNLILALYLSFSTIGMFTFVAVDSVRLEDFSIKTPAAGASFIQTPHTIDCWAVNSSFNKAGGQTSSSLRYGSLRTAILSGIHNTGTDFFFSDIKAKTPIMHYDIKNTILLKLRI